MGWPEFMAQWPPRPPHWPHLGGGPWQCALVGAPGSVPRGRDGGGGVSADLQRGDLLLQGLLAPGGSLGHLPQLGGAALLQALHLVGAVALALLKQLARVVLLLLKAHLQHGTQQGSGVYLFIYFGGY